VCDDLRLTVGGGQIIGAERACELGERWLQLYNNQDALIAEIEGRPAKLDEAIERSAEILRLASYPLIYGLSQSNTAGQRAAVSLAERLGAVIDTSASVCHAPSVMAQQEVGKVTCTLGEIRNHADLVIFWGSDPLNTHPRHWERYSVDPPGRFVRGGRADRFVVVADTTRTTSADAADVFLPVEPGRHFEALYTLRAIIRDAVCEGSNCLGAPASLLHDLAERMKRARTGAMFFGSELAREECGNRNVQALLQLVADLNDLGRRWYAMRMRVQGNVVGADTVLAWQTSYPFAVDMARGYPRYNPGEFSVQGLLGRHEVDACFLVGSETLSWLPRAAIDHLRQIPTVLVDSANRETPVSPTVRFRTAAPGIHVAGTAYRMDGVPVPLRPVLPNYLPDDAQILVDIERRL
jgi:formylmethanofuran dehydrogenase subunit B